MSEQSQDNEAGFTLSRKQSSVLIGVLFTLLMGGTVGGFSLGGLASKQEVQAIKLEVQSLKLEVQALNRTWERLEDRIDRVIDGP